MCHCKVKMPPCRIVGRVVRKSIIKEQIYVKALPNEKYPILYFVNSLNMWWVLAQCKNLFHSSGLSELSLTALSSIYVFHHLTACAKFQSKKLFLNFTNTFLLVYLSTNFCFSDCNQSKICSILDSSLAYLPDPNKDYPLTSLHLHLLRGAVLISLGRDQLHLSSSLCPVLAV